MPPFLTKYVAVIASQMHKSVAVILPVDAANQWAGVVPTHRGVMVSLKLFIIV